MLCERVSDIETHTFLKEVHTFPLPKAVTFLT